MDDSNPEKKVFHPIINGLQKMALYTTRSRCYLVGTNNTQTKFRVLKIDRTEPHELMLTDDNVEYSQSEIKELLSMIGGGNKSNRVSTAAKVSGGVTRTVSAFGIFGFIRFLEGFYLILITKRRKVAVIGQHSVYKVEDTSIIYIPHESVRKTHDDEHKYLKLLSNMDLTSNFYFSYTCDLTHSLQHNMSPVNNIVENIGDATESFMHSSHQSTKPPLGNDNEIHYGQRSTPYEKYVWNNYLLEPLRKHAQHVWILPVIQGFIAQSNISVYGRSFFLTLIARRSALYAGTRFLKRGTNCEGDVANEVETEQIVHDAHISSQHHGKFTSFVQIRGSIPCHWSQDISKMVPKPPISIDVWDPNAVAAGKHFNKLLRRFGTPLIVLNLVKKREKKRHESILNEEYGRLINQLNLFLPPSHRIQHVAVDMARINKDKKENVMSRLADISYQAIKKTGIFQSYPPYYMNHITPNKHYKQLERTSMQGDSTFGNRRVLLPEERGRHQTGIVRVNCVDCLDRTNTAQFCLGKCALAFQLYTLGVLEKPSIEFDSACVRMLEEMYEDHGDTLALQYGGSQLVHRIATYRKTAPWSSQGNDIMQSLSRYLSNTFSDQEKQQAINLFLGVFVPLKEFCPIWELHSDYLLHHPLARNLWPCHREIALQWWDDEVMECLPLACDEVNKKPAYLFPLSKHDPRIDLYADYYRSYEFMVMSESFAFHMNHSSSYMDRNENGQIPFDENPFIVHGAPASNSDSKIKKGVRRKSLPFTNVGSSSNTSSGASSTETEPTDDEILNLSYVENDVEPDYFFSVSKPLTFATLFPPEEELYGDYVHPVQEHELEIYARYAHVQAFISGQIDREDSPANQKDADINIFDPALYTAHKDDSYSISPPIVSEFTVRICAEFIAIKIRGPVPPKNVDLLQYGMWTQSMYSF